MIETGRHCSSGYAIISVAADKGPTLKKEAFSLDNSVHFISPLTIPSYGKIVSVLEELRIGHPYRTVIEPEENESL